MIFSPRSSKGWFVNLILVILMATASYQGVTAAAKGVAVADGILALAGVGLTLTMIVVLLWYPTIRYELTDKALILKAGWVQSSIPFTEIKDIQVTDLKPSLLSSGWRLPGYAVMDVYYRDQGWIHMFSTRLARAVLLIQTEKGKYGLSPRDEAEFLSELRERMSDRSLVEVKA